MPVFSNNPETLTFLALLLVLAVFSRNLLVLGESLRRRCGRRLHTGGCRPVRRPTERAALWAAVPGTAEAADRRRRWLAASQSASPLSLLCAGACCPCHAWCLLAMPCGPLVRHGCCSGAAVCLPCQPISSSCAACLPACLPAACLLPPPRQTLAAPAPRQSRLSAVAAWPWHQHRTPTPTPKQASCSPVGRPSCLIAYLLLTLYSRPHLPQSSLLASLSTSHTFTFEIHRPPPCL
ncbi:hypothetical protein BC831DRAFT_143178 [Entophlyctis helioformis]|nr:hypothetical protein BC831DRAFT_143178 [Entophlyctis helioformis]